MARASAIPDLPSNNPKLQAEAGSGWPGSLERAVTGDRPETKIVGKGEDNNNTYHKVIRQKRKQFTTAFFRREKEAPE